MKRNVLILLIMTAMMVSTSAVFADTAAIPINKYTLTAQDIDDYIAKFNPEIQLLDKKIVILNNIFLSAKMDSIGAQTKNTSSTTVSVQARKDEQLTWKQKLLALDNASVERNDKMASIRASIRKQYFDLNVMQDNISSSKLELENIDRKIVQLNLDLKLGKIKTSDLKPYQAQKLQLLSQLSTFQRGYDISMLNLKKSIGFNLRDQVTLTYQNQALVKFDEANIEKRIQKALSKNYTLKQLKTDLDLTILERSLYYDESSSNMPSAASTLEISILEKNATLQDTTKSIEINYWTNLYDLRSLAANVEIEQINLESEQLDLTTNEMLYKIDRLTELDMMNSRLSVAKQKNKLQGAINVYMAAVDDFKYQLGE